MDAHRAYGILEVRQDASPEEIKSAYRRLALESHPDRSDGDCERFREINEAYNILKKEPRRSRGSGTRSRPRGAERSGGPRSTGKHPPEQDWSKYTSEFEDENPDFWREYERKFWEEYDKTVNADGRNGEYEKARESKVQPNLFVDVDPSLCIACQSCETIAPGVFHIDTESNMNPKSRVINMRGAKANRIMNAAQTCPTKAITVENRDTKERMYPL